MFEQFTPFLISTNAVLTGIVLGVIWVPIVIFGLHWAIIPIILSNLTTQGKDFLLPMIAGTLWVPGGLALGVFLKTKDSKLKEIALTGMIPCFFNWCI
ncbi:hypothetical protein MYY11_002880 [Enterococcus faecium]|nr:hypothetical protein [Enterococcus faecium]